MFPPGHGNDNLCVGRKFAISLFGTSEVFTVEGENVFLREYGEANASQIWVCERNASNRFGLRNVASGRYLGRTNKDDRIGCFRPDLLSMESLTFLRLGEGGYSLMAASQDNEHQHRYPLQQTDANSVHFNRAEGSTGTQFGLHQIKNLVFRRFEWVVPNRLARSSAPYYDGEDSDESINETSIRFLVKRGIQNIISLNSVEISPRERGRLDAAKISYSHIQTQQCCAPTQGQFDQIWNAFDKAGVTIAYCGYGDGRTGMAISAIQLFQGRTLSDMEYRANGVQCTSQIEALNTLSKRIRGADNHSDPSSTPGYQPPPYKTP
ncbi:hypothetical protein C7212DRAFT_292159 [Tuber magnatum]|uniref:Swiss Army Knife protein DSP-PTPase phosphatase domain-containing protein n=1 Tax=Tuber magnatum TaxID=42249 RepID=A0A317SUU4_9PEZI|nr:hypothetical protein C7212DRAFT_292159 [Tuber magnatum]